MLHEKNLSAMGKQRVKYKYTMLVNEYKLIRFVYSVNKQKYIL